MSKTSVLEKPVTKGIAVSATKPFMSQWSEQVKNPVGSYSMSNPDTSTYNKSTEDNDT
jgi:hypothetical protein